MEEDKALEILLAYSSEDLDMSSLDITASEIAKRKLLQDKKLSELFSLYTPSDLQNIGLGLLKIYKANENKSSKILRGLLRASNLNEDYDEMGLAVARKSLEYSFFASEQTKTILNILGASLENFSFSHLEVLAEDGVELLRDSHNTDFPLQLSWLEVLSKVLNLIAEEKESAKDKLVSSISQYEWKLKDSLGLLSMIVDVSYHLHTDVINSVIKKICLILSSIAPKLIPIYIYKLLILSQPPKCSTSIILSSLNSYFASCSGQESSGKSSSKWLVIQHLVHAVKSGHPIAKDAMKLFRCSYSGVYLNNFTVTLILALSSVKSFGSTSLENFKQSLLKHSYLEELSSKNFWLREIFPSKCILRLVELKLREVVSSSIVGERQHIIADGLLEFALSCIDHSGDLVERVKSLRDLGTAILIHAITSSSDYSALVLKRIIDRILFSPHPHRHVQNLQRIIAETGELIIPNLSTMDLLFDRIFNYNLVHNEFMLSQTILAVTLSKSVRDNFIMMIRKTLFKSKSESKFVAVFGILQLLKTLKIPSRSTSLTQNSSDISHSYMTQFAIEYHGGGVRSSNEKICIELIAVLKRCMRSHEGRITNSVYAEMPEIISANPELYSLCFDLFFSFGTYETLDAAHADSFISIIDESEVNIGLFLLGLRCLVNKAEDYSDPDEVTVSNVNKAKSLLKKVHNVWNDCQVPSDMSETNKTKIARSLEAIFECCIGFENGIQDGYVDCYLSVYSGALKPPSNKKSKQSILDGQRMHRTIGTWNLLKELTLLLYKRDYDKKDELSTLIFDLCKEKISILSGSSKLYFTDPDKSLLIFISEALSLIFDTENIDSKYTLDIANAVLDCLKYLHTFTPYKIKRIATAGTHFSGLQSMAQKVIAALTYSHEKFELEKVPSIKTMLKILTILLSRYGKEDPEYVKDVYKWAKEFSDKCFESHLPLYVHSLDLLLEIEAGVKTNPSNVNDGAKKIQKKLDESELTNGGINKKELVWADSVSDVLIQKLNSFFENSEIVMAVLKAKKSWSEYIKETDEMKDIDSEARICNLLARCANIISEILKTKYSIKTIYKVLRCCGGYYFTVSKLGQYIGSLGPRSKSVIVVSRFDRLVGVISESVTVEVYKAISYVEGRQTAREETRKIDKSELKAESKTIPDVIFRIAEFEKQLALLNPLCKADLLAGCKLSTARDFRIQN